MNNYASRNVVYGATWINGVLTGLKTLAGTAALATTKVRLSKDPAFDPTPASTRAALATAEADFSGYPAGGIATVWTPGITLSPSARGLIATAVFEGDNTDPFDANDVTGYWIDNGTLFVAGERFADAVIAVFAAEGDFLALEIFLPFQLLQETA